MNSREAPIIVDLDRDGQSEIVVGLTGQNWFDRGLGRIEVLRADGTRMPGWPVDPVPDGANIVTSVSVADVDRDNAFDVVAAVGRRPAGQEGGWWTDAIHEIHVFDADGSSLPGFPLVPVEEGHDPGFALALSDLDEDGSVDFLSVHVDQSFATIVSALRADGTSLPGWPRVLPWGPSAVAIGNVDEVEGLEIAMGTDRGDLYLFGHDGVDSEGWPVSLNACFYSVPFTVGNLDSDPAEEVVSTSWLNDLGLCVFGASGGKKLWKPIEDPFGIYLRVEAALVDIDNDGLEEAMLPRFWRDEPHGVFDAWKIDGTAPQGWPVSDYFFIGSEHEVSLVVADLCGDHNAEIVLGTYTNDIPHWPGELLNKGWIQAWYHDGTPIEGFPLGFPTSEVGLENGALAIGDVDGDGLEDLVMVRCEDANSGSPKTYVTLFALNTRVKEAAVEWARYHHDPYLTGDAEAVCVGGAVLGTCSQSKPHFCEESGGLPSRACELCGCPPDATCVPGGWCVSEERTGSGH